MPRRSNLQETEFDIEQRKFDREFDKNKRDDWFNAEIERSFEQDERELEKFDSYDASILEAFMKLQLLIDSFIELDSTSIVQANFGKIKVILVNFEQISQQIKRPMTFQNSERQSSYKSFDFLYAKVRYILTQIGRIVNMYDTI